MFASIIVVEDPWVKICHEYARVSFSVAFAMAWHGTPMEHREIASFSLDHDPMLCEQFGPRTIWEVLNADVFLL